jgi:peptide/nickel transport system substrate-binding protein/oligopeptide transport system substrate-binding protein
VTIHRIKPTRRNFARRDFVIGAATVGAALGSMSLLGGCGFLPVSTTANTNGGSDSAGAAGGAGGAGDGKETISRAGGTLYIASHWPYSFDPFYLQELAGIQMAACLFDPLVKYDYRSKKLIPAAAQEWAANEDGTVFTFKLVKGARFHNGEAVTAFDFKYSWERLLKPSPFSDVSGNAVYIEMIQGARELMAGEADEALGIRVVDKLTFEVTLDAPFHDFPSLLTYPAFAPVPSTGEADDFYGFDGMPIGNGPFKIERAWDWSGTSLKLMRFDDYYGTSPLLNAVEFVFFESDREQDTGANDGGTLLAVVNKTADKTTGKATDKVADRAVDKVADRAVDASPLTYAQKTYASFEFGEVDVAQVPVEEFEDALIRYGESTDGYSMAPGNQTLSGPEAYTQFLMLNFAQEPLVDVGVRRALSYAINREAICKELYFDTRVPATGIVPPDVEGFRDGAWPAAVYDVGKARQELRDAGYPAGKGLAPVMLVVSNSREDRRLFEMIGADLEAAGFKVKTSLVANNSQYWEVLDNSAGLAVTGWIADFPIMEDFITPLFASFGGYNQFAYSNAEVDEGIMAARTKASESERIKAFQAVEDLIAADMPAIPLFFMRHTLVCSDRTTDLSVAPDGMLDLSKTWLSF